jgi:hypothetical protein
MDPTLPMDDNVLQLGLIDLIFNVVGIFFNFLTTMVVPAAFDFFFQGLASLFMPAA